MWEMRRRDIPGGASFRVIEGDSNLSLRKLFALLESNASFARWYTDALSAADMAAYFWEHPPLKAATFDDAAEFVLIESDRLARLPADPESFEPQLQDHSEPEVVAFRNLSSDATLPITNA